MVDNLPPRESAGLEYQRQTKVMSEVMARRDEAPRELAIAKTIMDEDRALLGRLSKS